MDTVTEYSGISSSVMVVTSLPSGSFFIVVVFLVRSVFLDSHDCVRNSPCSLSAGIITDRSLSRVA